MGENPQKRKLIDSSVGPSIVSFTSGMKYRIVQVGSVQNRNQPVYNTLTHNTKAISLQRKNNEDEYADNHYDCKQLLDDYEKL